MLSEDEKKLLTLLTQKELEQIEKEEDSIIEQHPGFLAAETSYEEFLKGIIEKLK